MAMKTPDRAFCCTFCKPLYYRFKQDPLAASQRTDLLRLLALNERGHVWPGDRGSARVNIACTVWSACLTYQPQQPGHSQKSSQFSINPPVQRTTSPSASSCPWCLNFLWFASKWLHTSKHLCKRRNNRSSKPSKRYHKEAATWNNHSSATWVMYECVRRRSLSKLAAESVPHTELLQAARKQTRLASCAPRGCRLLSTPGVCKTHLSLSQQFQDHTNLRQVIFILHLHLFYISYRDVICS